MVHSNVHPEIGYGSLDKWDVSRKDMAEAFHESLLQLDCSEWSSWWKPRRLVLAVHQNSSHLLVDTRNDR
jgi:hypothetical protein